MKAIAGQRGMEELWWLDGSFAFDTPDVPSTPLLPPNALLLNTNALTQNGDWHLGTDSRFRSYPGSLLSVC